MPAPAPPLGGPGSKLNWRRLLHRRSTICASTVLAVADSWRGRYTAKRSWTPLYEIPRAANRFPAAAELVTIAGRLDQGRLTTARPGIEGFLSHPGQCGSGPGD